MKQEMDKALEKYLPAGTHAGTHADTIRANAEPGQDEQAAMHKINNLTRLIGQMGTLDEAHRHTLHCLADRGPVEALQVAITANVNILLSVAEHHGIEVRPLLDLMREPSDEQKQRLKDEITRETKPVPREDWDKLCDEIRATCVRARRVEIEPESQPTPTKEEPAPMPHQMKVISFGEPQAAAPKEQGTPNVSDWYQAVWDFHKKFGCHIEAEPTPQPESIRDLRKRLIEEEVIKETLPAIDRNDLPAIADGIVDSIYVLIGTAVSYGIDLRPVFDEVQAANMAKEGGGTRADGKILKPAGWTPPDVAAIIERQKKRLAA